MKYCCDAEYRSKDRTSDATWFLFPLAWQQHPHSYSLRFMLRLAVWRLHKWQDTLLSGSTCGDTEIWTRSCSGQVIKNQNVADDLRLLSVERLRLQNEVYLPVSARPEAQMSNLYGQLSSQQCWSSVRTGTRPGNREETEPETGAIAEKQGGLLEWVDRDQD